MEMSLDGSKVWAERPQGMRDVYTKHAKLQRFVENQSVDFFADAGFDVVSSGIFEYVDTLLRGRQKEEAESWVKWFDDSGRAIALRPEMTPSIARMAAPLLGANHAELRWCYCEPVFRRAGSQANLARTESIESVQVGVEWIGPTGPQVDAAVLCLCLDAMANLGISDAQLVVSHTGFTSAFLKTLGVKTSAVSRLLHYLSSGDYVEFRQEVRQMGIEFDVLHILGSLNPFVPESLEGIPAFAAWRELPDADKVLGAWEDLVVLAKQLATYSRRDGILFDLTLQRDLSYYTGIVFEIFQSHSSAPIALGGRYDDLLAQFGTPTPAIGFILEVDRLCTVLEHLSIGSRRDTRGVAGC